MHTCILAQTFGAPLDAVGALLLTTTAGYLLASFTSGASIARLGMGGLLLVSALVAGGGPLGYVAAPVWWVMVAIGFIAGLGGGVVDAGLNTYIATNHGLTLMNWLHESATVPTPKASSLDTLRLPIVWLGIALFVVFTGLPLWPVCGSVSTGASLPPDASCSGSSQRVWG